MPETQSRISAQQSDCPGQDECYRQGHGQFDHLLPCCAATCRAARFLTARFHGVVRLAACPACPRDALHTGFPVLCGQCATSALRAGQATAYPVVQVVLHDVTTSLVDLVDRLL